MNVSVLLIRLIAWLFPGVLCSILYRRFTKRHRSRDLEDFMECMVFAAACYVTVELACFCVHHFGIKCTPFSSFSALFVETQPMPYWKVTFSCVAAFPVALVLAWQYRTGFLYRISNLFGASKGFYHQSVWDFFLTSPSVNWVRVIDHERKLVYCGWITAYSDGERETVELMMEDVRFFSTKGNEPTQLHFTPAMFLSRPRTAITIEVIKDMGKGEG